MKLKKKFIVNEKEEIKFWNMNFWKDAILGDETFSADNMIS